MYAIGPLDFIAHEWRRESKYVFSVRLRISSGLFAQQHRVLIKSRTGDLTSRKSRCNDSAHCAQGVQ